MRYTSCGRTEKAGSHLTRAGPTNGPPTYTKADRYSLDGVELVHCAPNCHSGGTRETRTDSDERLVFDGIQLVRWKTDGTKITYAPTQRTKSGPAANTYQWDVTSVTDTHGNNVQYVHNCDEVWCYLHGIEYGATPPDLCKIHGQPRPSGTHIEFYYEPRSDPVDVMTGDGYVTITKRLRTIAIIADDKNVRTYALSYVRSAQAGASLLKQVQEYGRYASKRTRRKSHTGPE